MPFLDTSAYLQTGPLARRLCRARQAQLTANAVNGERIYRGIREPLPSLSWSAVVAEVKSAMAESMMRSLH